MLLITCPYCGPRPEMEFANAGEAHLKRPDASQNLSEQAWAEYLFYRSNPKGRHMERWRHIHGCGKFFNAVRDTRDERFLATYEIGSAPAPDPDGQAKQK